MIHSREITYNLHKVVFLMDKIADKMLQEKMQLSFSQLRCLIAIDDKTVSQCDIAEYWDMTEAAVSRQIESLVKSKQVKRKENAENRREHLLSLTEQGRKDLDKAIHLLDSTYEKIYHVINQEERVVLVAGLHKLLKVICTGSKGDPCVGCK